MRSTDDFFSTTLTTGADGMVGSYIDFGIRTNRRTLDVTDLSEVRAVCKRHMPKLIIHLAAETDLAQCERDPAYAFRVNTVGTYNVALAARDVGAKLVYVSTSGVFDGTKGAPYAENDIPNPLNEYGHSKYLGELAVKGIVPEYLIVRTAWVFGGGPAADNKFVGKIMRQIQQSDEIRAVIDKHGSPTYGKDLVEAVKELIAEKRTGIFHVANSGTLNRADVAREIVSITGSRAQVHEARSDVFDVGYKIGDNESITSSYFSMRPWQEALQEYITSEWNTGHE